jgi:2-keto-4-pentenoate hydratase/2-oxohepta-3-ene-1,7-dioic acid hydratase in catechol pathway
MRFATFSTGGGPPHLGAVLGGDRVFDLTDALPDDPAMAWMLGLIRAGTEGLERARAAAGAASTRKGTDERNARVHPLADVRLLAPIPRPGKNVFCVGLNYRSHVEANARALGIRPEIGDVPLFFTKPTTAVIGPGDAIHVDRRLTQKLDYEVELAIVIGRGGTWIDEADALGHVFGFTLLNDVSARDLQWRTTQMFIGKGLDTYCPIGPWIVDREEAGDGSAVELICRVNGEERQRDSTSELIFGVPRIVAELSKGMTLEPGDIISTGTPGGCGYQLVPPRFLEAGDVVELEAPGFGRLVNPVAAWGSAPPHTIESAMEVRR